METTQHTNQRTKERKLIMPQTYSIAITDGGSMPIDIKINLTFKEALKEALSHLEDQDITQICNLYAISTKDHKIALTRIQEIIEKHLKEDNEFYYDNTDNDNTIISINTNPKNEPLNNIRIEVAGYNFFAFAKQEKLPLN